MRLFLVRHAQTSSNVGRALDTAYPGAGLTDLGLEQASRLASVLAAQPLDAVAASPLLRARQTAEPLASARRIAVATLDGLREVAAGDLEMQSSPDAIGAYRTVLVAWATGDLDAVMPGGTSGHEFLAAFDESVQAIEDMALTAVAVSHGAAIRTWGTRLRPLGHRETRALCHFRLGTLISPVADRSLAVRGTRHNLAITRTRDAAIVMEPVSGASLHQMTTRQGPGRPRVRPGGS